MNNKLPPPPTEMCEPDINWKSVNLQLSNNTYKSFVRLFAKWKSQETLFINGKFIRRNNYATGRIKRMRKDVTGLGWNKRKSIKKISIISIRKLHFGQIKITRWNRH